MDEMIIGIIDSRMRTARLKYGPIASTHEALGVAMEEWDEFREAIKRNELSEITQEALDLAAVLIRLVAEFNTNELLKARSTK